MTEARQGARSREAAHHRNIDAAPRLRSGVSIDGVEVQVGRILASESFARSKRLSRFLRFAVEKTIQDAADDLKEFSIGIEVFDRDESFDPRVDSIVRVEACRLRSKLRAYYETEGRRDPILIKFRKGSYAPLFLPKKPTNIRPEPQESGPASQTSCNTIAVFPFVDLGPELDQMSFCHGMTDELVQALAKAPGMRVVDPSAVISPTGVSEDIRKIGRELQVDAVFEGSVRRAEDRLRITAKLVHVSTGCVLWSETYARLLEDVLATQEEIAEAIVTALKLELHSGA